MALTMEALIRQQLIQSKSIASKLARFAGIPAIFYQSVPDEKAVGWTENTIYPRLVFTTDSFTDANRDIKKTLFIDIMCAATGVMPEHIEPLIKESIENVFFTPEKGETFSAKWRESQVFSDKDKNSDNLIYGMTLSFDIYEYPLLETSNPDPIIAMCLYTKMLDPAISVIGFDELSAVTIPSEEAPAIWFSKGANSLEKQTNTVVWVNDVVNVHLFAPTLKARLNWLTMFSRDLALAGDVRMMDESPMFIKQIKGDMNSDEINGQLNISVRYGLLRIPHYAHAITKVNYDNINSRRLKHGD